jgi:hypothetical protein
MPDEWERGAFYVDIAVGLGHQSNKVVLRWFWSFKEVEVEQHDKCLGPGCYCWKTSEAKV